MKKYITFYDCKSVQDIEKTINDALEYDEVVKNEEEAQQWFKAAEMDGELISRDILNTCVSIWNEEMKGEEIYRVVIYEHYIDPGSMDYVYSYEIKPK